MLSGVEGIGFFHFDERDVVRHPLVQQIVTAYDRHEQRRSGQNGAGAAALRRRVGEQA